MQDIISQLEAKRELARLGGGQKRIAAQHAKGKLTARERIELLLDEDSFEEWICLLSIVVAILGWPIQTVPSDGVVTGYGMINGPSGLCVFTRLHGLRWLALGSPCREDLQDHGSGYEGGCTRDWFK